MISLLVSSLAAADSTFVTRTEFADLTSRFDALVAENAELRQRISSLEQNAPEPRTAAPIVQTVLPSGRQLTSSSPSCCRWTQTGTCPSSQSELREYKCTSLHEYLEDKVVTHEFDDVESCLGTDEAAWRWRFDPISSASVILGTTGSDVATVPLSLIHI